MGSEMCIRDRAWKGVKHDRVDAEVRNKVREERKDATLAALLDKQEREMGLLREHVDSKSTPRTKPKPAASPSSGRFKAVDLTWSSHTPPRDEAASVKFQANKVPQGATAQHALKMRQLERERRAAQLAAEGHTAAAPTRRQGGGGGRVL